MPIAQYNAFFEANFGRVEPTNKPNGKPMVRVEALYLEGCPPRLESLRSIREVGWHIINQMWSETVLSELPENWSFMFPERWMSQREIHNFGTAIIIHPNVAAGRVKRIRIVTGSNMLVAGLIDLVVDIRKVRLSGDFNPHEGIQARFEQRAMMLCNKTQKPELAENPS